MERIPEFRTGEKKLRLFHYYTLFLMIVYPAVSGCQEQSREPKGDVKYTHHRNGNVESSTEYSGGVRHGYQRFFDEDGKLLSETRFVNGSREGVMKAYYPDGTLKMSGTYVNDRLEGEVLSFYPGGKLESKKIFKNSKMIYNIRYTEDGKVEYEDKF